MQNVAVFDFDGTIYKKDSLIEFAKFVYKTNPWRIFFVVIQGFALLLHTFKLISTTQFKQTFLIYLIGLSSKLNNLIDEFWKKEFPVNFNPEVLSMLANAKNDEVICITASPDFMFTRLTKQLHLTKCISTVTTIKNGNIKILGKNCRGEEKIKRLQKEFPNGYILNLAISDNKDDFKLLSSAKTAYQVINNNITLLK